MSGHGAPVGNTLNSGPTSSALRDWRGLGPGFCCCEDCPAHSELCFVVGSTSYSGWALLLAKAVPGGSAISENWKNPRWPGSCHWERGDRPRPGQPQPTLTCCLGSDGVLPEAVIPTCVAGGPGATAGGSSAAEACLGDAFWPRLGQSHTGSSR